MKKWIALIICVAIICIDIPVQAKTVDPEKSMLELYPSVITEQQKKENKFVKRLSQYDEYENAIGYENEDGTKTVLIYADNIKYKDSNGIDMNHNIKSDSYQKLMSEAIRSFNTKKIMLYIMTVLIIYLTDSLLFATNSATLFLYGKKRK